VVGVHFKCADCPGAIDLCVECLVAGTPAPEAGGPGGHTAAHGYRVADNAAAFTLFERDWSAADEVALLEGVDVYGMGNWRDIAAYIGGGKTEAAASRRQSGADCEDEEVVETISSPVHVVEQFRSKFGPRPQGRQSCPNDSRRLNTSGRSSRRRDSRRRRGGRRGGSVEAYALGSECRGAHAWHRAFRPLRADAAPWLRAAARRGPDRPRFGHLSREQSEWSAHVDGASARQNGRGSVLGDHLARFPGESAGRLDGMSLAHTRGCSSHKRRR
jgi:hypothetical protein